MTSSVITNKNQLLNQYGGFMIDHNISEIFDIAHCVADYRYVNNIHSYYINPDHLTHRRAHMEGKLVTNYTRIPAGVFLPTNTYTENCKILVKNHINCWRAAMDDDRDGAFFFEDDVYFLKNWKNVVANIFKNKGRENVNIIRFDPIPFIRADDLCDNECVVFPLNARACMGGYYMSINAISRALNEVNLIDNYNGDVEQFLNHICYSHYNGSIYETTPRICIQNWFLNNESTLQQSDHMILLRNAMNSYLKQYKHRYDLNEDELLMIEDNIKQDDSPPFVEKILGVDI